ncbi:hypothetical protein DL89DRAFT_140979 [Linderina pennispora]|uniref:Uncharacterized protein n=1 Tax=Linderina pennispora TaxID=61395 RepID=A0A1Y1WB94_9FUNG|nr:uncharacterized protein DL89DRAFT_140979 [Linderina pennispora]ORX70810.1 hypothetical protein DL89DRAFT_140979 [Linderina pennispora]
MSLFYIPLLRNYRTVYQNMLGDFLLLFRRDILPLVTLLNFWMGSYLTKPNWPSVNSLRISGDLLSALTNRNQGEHRADNCDTISQYLHAYLPP